MDRKRNSEQIDGELQTLRKKIGALEGQRQENQKAVEKAKKQRTARAFAAHADGDKQAGEQLVRAREIQVKAALELEDLESAISEGGRRLHGLQREHEVVYQAEQWAALFAEADQESAEADKITVEGKSFAQRLARHQRKIDELKRRANNLSCPRAFQTCGIRHALRMEDWYLIQAGVETETAEKPSSQYRESSGYGEIFRQQVEAAKAQVATQSGHDTTEPAAQEDGAESKSEGAAA